MCVYVSYVAFARITHKEFPPKTFRLSKMNLSTGFYSTSWFMGSFGLKASSIDILGARGKVTVCLYKYELGPAIKWGQSCVLGKWGHSSPGRDPGSTQTVVPVCHVSSSRWLLAWLPLPSTGLLVGFAM